jgi:putative transposase
MVAAVLDDFSRYIIAWKLCSTMRAEDVTDTLELALAASGCDRAHVQHKPRLLSDNGPNYIADELAEWIDTQGMSHVRGAPMHPQTQGKIERWHQALKNRILLENYFLPAISNARSRPSSSTTTIGATTRASTTSLPPTPTSAGPMPSSSSAKGSSDRQSTTDACSTASSPPNINTMTSQTLR